MAIYSPDELLTEFRRRRSAFTGAEFFNRPGMTRLQEMWCAARFAAGVDAHIEECKVLIEDVDEQDETDFRLLFPGGTARAFQLVEVQKEGRRRGDEYKQRLPGSTFLEDLTAPSAVVARVAEAIERKAMKHYANQARLHLLVYLNVGTYDLHLVELQRQCATVSAGFEGVWVMTGEMFGCLHLSRERVGQAEWMRLPHC